MVRIPPRLSAVAVAVVMTTVAVVPVMTAVADVTNTPTGAVVTTTETAVVAVVTAMTTVVAVVTAMTTEAAVVTTTETTEAAVVTVMTVVTDRTTPTAEAAGKTTAITTTTDDRRRSAAASAVARNMELIYDSKLQRVFYDEPRPEDTQVDPILLSAGTVIQLPVGVSTVYPSLDFETYSHAGYVYGPDKKIRGVGSQGKGGLPVVGTPNYMTHPSTEAMCLSYNMKRQQGVKRWLPGGPDPHDLLDYVADGGILEAHNVTFEFWAWRELMAKRYGWPPLSLSQCRCVMARARRHSLPGKLDIVTKVLGVAEKDAEGTKIMRKLSRPHTPTKNRPGVRWTLRNSLEEHLKLYDYCDQDTIAEDGAAARIPDLTEYEHGAWYTDQVINLRGVQVDMNLLEAAKDILAQAAEKYTKELFDLTDGKVTSVAEVKKLREWVNSHGVGIEDLKAPTIKETLKRDDLPAPARRALEIRAGLASSNVKKFRTIGLQVSADGRLRDQYMYCGADRTGRWSAGGAQLHNLTSKAPKSMYCPDCKSYFGAQHLDACPFCNGFKHRHMSDWTVEAMEDLIKVVLLRDLPTLEYFWGDPLLALCGLIRGLFIAEEGSELICCDFSAIEAVVAACVSRCEWRIKVFEGDAKIYEASASKATGIPLEEIFAYKKRTGVDHPARKKIGKVRELAGGYGGWINSWKNFGADKHMNDEEIKADVLKWRDESPEIVEMWGGQFRQTGERMSDGYPELYGIEGAAISAILEPGREFSHTDACYFVKGDILYCRLPSGRHLHYHRPRLVPEAGKWGRPDCYKITFEGYNSNTQKGPIGWHAMETYGARMFENFVQAVAADIQAEALQRCEANGYPIVMHTHDEGSAEKKKGQGSVEEMNRLLSVRPTWAKWWPIRADGWVHRRYHK